MTLKIAQNVDVLISRIPQCYEQSCYETKAIQRKRGIKSPLDLLRLVLLYLVQGYSLKEISAVALLLKIGQLSHTAFMNRFAACNDWLASIIQQILPKPVIEYTPPQSLEGYAIAAVDGSVVREKSRSGQIFKLHYMLNILSMCALSQKITDEKTGESLTNFDLKAIVKSVGGKLLIIADRAYGSIRSISHCINNGADFILRLKYSAFTLYDEFGNKVDLLSCLMGITTKTAKSINVFYKDSSGKLHPLRICAIRIPDDKLSRVERKGYRKGKGYKKRDKTSQEAADMRKYIVLATSLGQSVSADEIIEIYRYRWQIELYFKRLKSIMDFGNVPLHRKDSIMTWLNGKLLISILTEQIISEIVFPPKDKGTSQHLA